MNRVEGSVWGRWDLHFHTPSSYDYKDKSITDEELIRNLVESQIVAVAITDHHFIDVRRIENLSRLAGGRLAVFPGIELRSELGGKESVHLIGIFSEASDLTYVWTKLQGLLGLTEKEVHEKGNDNVYVQFENAATEIHNLDGVVSARTRRQVIIVTHNPNLAVVCDADQIIHSDIDKTADNKVTYESGALENSSLNRLSIDVLEGTRPAFSQRDSKYHDA